MNLIKSLRIDDPIWHPTLGKGQVTEISQRFFKVTFRAVPMIPGNITDVANHGYTATFDAAGREELEPTVFTAVQAAFIVPIRVSETREKS